MLGVEAKQIKFTPQPAMVALFGLFQAFQVFLKLRRRFPGRAVDSL
jgi:hypothetical protein